MNVPAVACFGVVPSVKDFVDAVVDRAKKMSAAALSAKQIHFLYAVLSYMALHGCLEYTGISRSLMGLMSVASIAYMFKSSKIPLDELARAGVCLLFEIYKPTRVALVIDDTDRHRSKVVKALAFVFKTICKATKGFVQAQNIVFICIVTDRFTIPVGWAFYYPDQRMKAWEKTIRKLKKAGCHPSQFPPKPAKDPNCPTRIEICESLLFEVKDLLREVTAYLKANVPNYQVPRVQLVAADAGYMSPEMCRYVRKIFSVNFISQLKCNQLVLKGDTKIRLDKFFMDIPKIKQTVPIRGKNVEVEFASQILHVKSHGQRLLIVALRYKDDKSWRYAASTDLTWRPIDIIRGYGLRWLIETFNEDWKAYGGWGKKALQQGDEGSSRGVILSLLIDYFYLWHPVQRRLHRLDQPLCTTGSLVEQIRVEQVIRAIETALTQPEPKAYLESIKKAVEAIFVARPSTKHAAGGMGFEYPDDLEPQPVGGPIMCAGPPG